MIAAGLFLVTALLLGAFAVLAILRIVQVEMSGSSGIQRDGLHRGASAPSWSLPDSSGRAVTSPPSAALQLIVFTNHSLKSFPSVVDGLRELAEQATGLELIVLLREQSDIAEPVLRLLGLGEIPVITGSPSLYGRYNVRVLPWMMFVDSSGNVRSSSLVNDAWQISRLWRLAQVPLLPTHGSAIDQSGWRRKLSVGV